MDAHRVEVFDGADDDAVVLAVADNFHFVFFPAEQGLLNQEFVCRREFEAAGTNLDEFFHVVRNTAAGAAERETRTNNGREADLSLDL